MKLNLLPLMTALGLWTASAAFGQSDSANTTPRGRGFGFGYGGPPQSARERADRHAACLDRHGGICPRSGCPWGV